LIPQLAAITSNIHHVTIDDARVRWCRTAIMRRRQWFLSGGQANRSAYELAREHAVFLLKR
jgi:hypothetical protein